MKYSGQKYIFPVLDQKLPLFKRTRNSIQTMALFDKNHEKPRRKAK
jgi:hypothetical protein